MFGKKKPVEEEKPVKKVNQYAIDGSLENTRDSIQEMLNKYDEIIQNYTNKVVELLKTGKKSDAERFKEKLKHVMYRKERMARLYDQVESFQLMIDEAFAKQEVYKTLGKSLSDLNGIVMNPKISDMMKDMKQFEQTFSQSFNNFDTAFSSVEHSMNKIDLDTSNEYDAEISASINQQMKDMENTTFNTDKGDDDISSLLNTL